MTFRVFKHFRCSMMKRMGTSLRGAILLLTTVAVIAAIVLLRVQVGKAGQQSTVGSTSSGSTEATPSSVASYDVGPCGSRSAGVVVQYDGASPTLANRTVASQVVAIGVVQSIGLPRWNTPDGSAPTFTAQGHPPEWALIYRPAVLSVVTKAKGSPLPQLTVRLVGGVVDCYSYSLTGGPAPAIGSRYAVFLGLSRLSDGFTSSQLTLFDAWPINPDGSISTPEEGNMSLSSFVSGAAAVP